jgi:hypothetical protein
MLCGFAVSLKQNNHGEGDGRNYQDQQNNSQGLIHPAAPNSIDGESRKRGKSETTGDHS